jgi:hypothetical protein
MQVGRRDAAFGLSLLLSLLLLSAPASAQLKDENLLVAMPPGFKVGFQTSKNGMNMQELVPAGETVENWTEMVTVQIFLGRRDLDPVRFLATIQNQWLGACKGSTAARIANVPVNAYVGATMQLSCPLNPGTGKPETAMFKAIRGTDSFYSVQRAVRAIPNAEQTARMTQYLAEVIVCDTRSPAHPCAAGFK